MSSDGSLVGVADVDGRNVWIWDEAEGFALAKVAGDTGNGVVARHLITGDEGAPRLDGGSRSCAFGAVQAAGRTIVGARPGPRRIFF